MDDPWWSQNYDTTQGIAGIDELINHVVTGAGRDWFEGTNDLSYDNYYSTYGGGENLPIFAALNINSSNGLDLDPDSTVGVRWDTGNGYAVGDNAKAGVDHYYLNATLIGAIGSFSGGVNDKIFHVNSKPTGTPELLEGHITIDTTSIQDPDNHEGWTPTYKFSWEISDNSGSAPIDVWESLNSDDATDGDNKIKITDDLKGKLIRGVVSYVDGQGTDERLETASSLIVDSNSQDFDDPQGHPR